jgi:hypothetical protein
MLVQKPVLGSRTYPTALSEIDAPHFGHFSGTLASFFLVTINLLR